MAWRRPGNIREWLNLVFRYKARFFFPAITVMIVVMVLSHQIDPKFTARVKFERRTGVEAQETRQGVSRRNIETMRTARGAEIRSRASVEAVIADLGLDRHLPRGADGELDYEGQRMKNQLVNEMIDNISVWTPLRTDAMDHVMVSYTDADRTIVARVANTLVENYIRQVKQRLGEDLLNAKNFFEREVKRYQDKETELESALTRFKISHKEFDPENPAALVERIDLMRDTLRTVQSEKNEARQQLEARQARLEETPEMIERQYHIPNPARETKLMQLEALRQELNVHLYQWQRTEEHPMVIKTRARITQLEGELADMKDEVQGDRVTEPNAQYAQLQALIEDAQARLDAKVQEERDLMNTIERLEISNNGYNQARAEYQSIMRQLVDAREQYKFWEEHLRRTSLALTTTIQGNDQRLTIIDRADDFGLPSSPTLLGILSAAAVLGFGLGGLIILFSELLDHSFRSVEQAVDELKLPVLGAVNEIVTPTDVFKRKVLSYGAYPALAGLMLLILLVTFFVTYLRLFDPMSYDQLMGAPLQYLRNALRL